MYICVCVGVVIGGAEIETASDPGPGEETGGGGNSHNQTNNYNTNNNDHYYYYYYSC